MNEDPTPSFMLIAFAAAMVCLSFYWVGRFHEAEEEEADLKRRRAEKRLTDLEEKVSREYPTN